MLNQRFGSKGSKTRSRQSRPIEQIWGNSVKIIRAKWPGLNTLIEIESEHFIQSTEQYSVEFRYYLGSKVQSAAQCNEQVKQHLAIKNQSHWTMDVTFGEDQSRKRKNNAPQNFGLIRRMALNLLKTNGDKTKVSINRRMNRGALSDKYRENTLQF